MTVAFWAIKTPVPITIQIITVANLYKENFRDMILKVSWFIVKINDFPREKLRE
jgi:hypothetical protein